MSLDLANVGEVQNVDWNTMNCIDYHTNFTPLGPGYNVSVANHCNQTAMHIRHHSD